MNTTEIATGNCYWCGTFGTHTIPDCINWCLMPWIFTEPLCGDCHDWQCNELDNPEGLPDQPDRRTLTCDYLNWLFSQTPLSNNVNWQNVAECLHHWKEPGRIGPWIRAGRSRIAARRRRSAPDRDRTDDFGASTRMGQYPRSIRAV